ncbi:prepilin-type N-terminal cleavage/methylation domain-containing protein [Pseudoxanthomonas winnipegensis]|jgi:type IV fimbrial biogenesis protein FimT|uniref:Type II secretion system protein H n=1 Tax=Pseudoxanthomonas winnipegensis TaxID=2480810 RepID=A0ABY1WB55_9GAMM|nr:GspH/FimT family pseudopilin [Pseudoxanthomonas winnipegensis]TAA10817.1 prepilin-type N-terminal cleavage/methylation domain-containing protein [Pseudoxanthomonas winnipegensis]TAA18244.1 prepilin-type N-terminal cleavage/methylation domain-containing protein [Pseudoxanthomonas winnipegensis]TAH74682.1 prepilin-type N-terminal cleavage/methylation domain-containing protein [Pseudoxanthomonas winnipegensis]
MNIRPSRKDRRHARGFTLVESLVVLAVASIGLAIGVPSYNALLRHQREAATTNLLSSFLASARSTAISYRIPTVVCPSLDKKECRDDSDWTQGWIMFFDADGNRRPDLSEDLLRVESAPRDPDLRILSTGGRPKITFLANGSAAGTNLTIRLCRGATSHASVIVNQSGRTRVEKPRTSKGCES